jgi:hypothetical protein
MIKIRVFSDFADSKKCKEVYENICDAFNLDFYGENKEIIFTNDDDYTHAIIFNTVMPELKIPKQNVVGLAFEPFEYLNMNQSFINYAKKHIGRYLIGDKRDLPEPFIERFGYMWYSNPKRDITHKKKIMSIVVSEKKYAPGHKYRHTLVENIIKYKLPIDIYGRGSIVYKGENIKGVFNDSEPYEDYLYSICIENFASNHYFSEKIITPILYNCMPLYLGCKNIKQYFNDIISLTGNPVIDIKTLIVILQNPMLYYNKTYTKKNENTVNILHNIDKLFEL